jgi:hypothetical protein
MPTICIQASASSVLNRLPMGIDVGNLFFASAWLMTATFLRARRILRSKATPGNDRNAHGLKERVAYHVHVFGVVVVACFSPSGMKSSFDMLSADIRGPTWRTPSTPGKAANCLFQPLVQRTSLPGP